MARRTVAKTATTAFSTYAVRVARRRLAWIRVAYSFVSLALKAINLDSAWSTFAIAETRLEGSFQRPPGNVALALASASSIAVSNWAMPSATAR